MWSGLSIFTKFNLDKGVKKGLANSVVWTLGGQISYMLIGLLGNVLLARLLSPSEFGQMAIGMFFVVLINVLVESGFSGALIRMPDVTVEDYSTVFIFNLAVSIIFSVAIFFSSGLIAFFYDDPALGDIIKALSLIPLLSSFQIIYNAKLVKEMSFRKRALYRFVSLFFATVLSILMALLSFGVWSIVFLQILNSLFLTILYFIFEPKIFSFKFNNNSFKKMYAFGVNTTIASLLNTGFENIYQLIIGKFFSLNQVGLFYQAKRLQEVPDNMFKIVILNVYYAHLAKNQENYSNFKNDYNKISLLSSVVVGLVTIVVVIFSDTIILALYGDKWLTSSFYLQLLAITSFFYIHEMLNRNIFKIFDKTRSILYLEIVKKIIQSITIVAGVYYLNISYLLVGYLFTSIISYFSNLFYSRKIFIDKNLYELKILLKIVLIFIILIPTSLILIQLFNFNTFNKLLLLPVIILFYLILLKMVGVADIRKDYKTFIKL